MNVTKPDVVTSVGYLSHPNLDMLWSEPFYIRKRYVRSFKLTEITLTVLVLHHLTFSNRVVNVTKPDVVTSVGYLSQPILDMLWSEPCCVRKRIVKLFKCHEIALTVRLLHHFTFTNWAVYVTKPVVITSVGGLSHLIHDMLWSEPFVCATIQTNQNCCYRSPFAPFNVLEPGSERDKTRCCHFGRRVVAA